MQTNFHSKRLLREICCISSGIWVQNDRVWLGHVLQRQMIAKSNKTNGKIMTVSTMQKARRISAMTVMESTKRIKVWKLRLAFFLTNQDYARRLQYARGGICD